MQPLSGQGSTKKAWTAEEWRGCAPPLTNMGMHTANTHGYSMRVITATAVRGLPHCVGRGDCPVQPAMTPHAANSVQHATAAMHHVVQAVLTPAPCRPHAAGSGMQGTLRSDATEGLNGCGDL